LIVCDTTILVQKQNRIGDLLRKYNSFTAGEETELEEELRILGANDDIVLLLPEAPSSPLVIVDLGNQVSNNDLEIKGGKVKKGIEL